MLQPRGENLLPVDQIALIIAAGEGADLRGVTAGLRLGDGHRLQPHPAGGDLGKEAPLLLLVPVTKQRAHCVHLRVTCRGIAATGVDLLEHDAGLDHAEAGAAVLRRNQDREPSAVRQRLDELLRILLLGIEPAPVVVRESGADLTDGLAKLLLLGR